MTNQIRQLSIPTLLLGLFSSFLALGADSPQTKEPPQVLIIGDSISIGYTPHVKQTLLAEANVVHNKGNAGPTENGLKNIDEWIGTTKWDVIHFNWGLHDLCYRNPDFKTQGRRDKVNGTISTSLDQYEKNLEILVQRLKKTGAALIWANTTVVPDDEVGRFVGDDIKFNEVAAKVMTKHGIAINDLQAVSRGFAVDTFAGKGNVHFKEDGYKKLAAQVVDKIRSSLASVASAKNIASTRRPNILFILVDDQSPFDFQFYNPRSALQSPNIDKLAEQGMVFDVAHHMGAFVGAVCTPSRHMIMCGRTVWHLPIAPEAEKYCPPNLDQNTLAAVFNRAGYDTMRTCKQGNSYEGANKQFTVRHDASKRGPTDETGSPWHGDQVMNYLNDRQATKDADPFLIYFGFSHPHDTRDGRPELLKKYGAVNHTDQTDLPPANSTQPELPINYLPAHPFAHGHPGLRDETTVSGVWEKRDERTIRNELGREFACSEAIDIQVGRVLAKLEAMGELENTFVFYTADHGIAIGRHGLQGKQNLYEHTWRVPLVVKGPGIKPGSRVPGNIYLLDTVATLCDIAGISAPPSNEGISFKPVLEGKQTTVRDVLYGVYCGGTKPGMRCVKKGDWKLIKYDVLDGAVQETQLFNLATNPHEFVAEHGKDDPALTNLANDPKHATKLAEMEAHLLSEMRRLNDPYRLWNQPEDGLASPPEGKKNKAKAGAK